MSNFSDFYGGGVKSVQRGVATPTSGAEMSVTVTAVNTAKSMLNLLSVTGGGSIDGSSRSSVRLINSTTVGISSSSGAYLAPLSWELIEFA